MVMALAGDRPAPPRSRPSDELAAERLHDEIRHEAHLLEQDRRRRSTRPPTVDEQKTLGRRATVIAARRALEAARRRAHRRHVRDVVRRLGRRRAAATNWQVFRELGDLLREFELEFASDLGLEAEFASALNPQEDV